MRRALGLLAGFGLAAYLGLCALLYFLQQDLLYHPVPEAHGTGASALHLSHDGETLKVWKAGDGRDAVVYFGGNAEDVSRNIPRFAPAFDDTALYFVNYRGYGGSSGVPGEAALYRDAAFVFDQLQRRHDSIAVIGRSLGSGVAVWLATERPVSKLVLVTPYDSIERVAQGLYPFIPVSLLIRDRYPSIERAAGLDIPVLILAATDDTVIPPRHTMALADALPPGRVRVHTFNQATHNSISSAPGYVTEIASFLRGRRSARIRYH